MNEPVFVYDPTAQDEMSRVRGVGRYLQILRENLQDIATFGADINNAFPDGIFLNPFVDIIKPPLTINRIAKKQIAVIHDLIPLKYPDHFPIGLKGKMLRMINTFLLSHYDLFITDSQASKADIMSLLGIASEKIQVIYPTLASTFWNQANKESIPDTELIKKLPEKFVVYVGDATWNKNLINIARAIKNSNVSAVFVGKVFTTDPTVLTHPWQNELKQFLQETQNDKRFYFPGFVTDEELVTLYRKAVANILISRDEGFGFSYLEAAVLGTPSILADRPIFHETADTTANFVASEDPTAISKQINELYSDPANAKKLGEKAQKHAALFSPEAFQKSLMALLGKTV